MTRQEIESNYTIDSDGIIRSPGAYEGEPIYAPAFWVAGLQGAANEETSYGAFIFFIGEEDVQEWPELGGIATIKLWCDDLGFVFCETISELGERAS